jgi:hypothetical protein
VPRPLFPPFFESPFWFLQLQQCYADVGLLLAPSSRLDKLLEQRANKVLEHYKSEVGKPDHTVIPWLVRGESNMKPGEGLTSSLPIDFQPSRPNEPSTSLVRFYAQLDDTPMKQAFLEYFLSQVKVDLQRLEAQQLDLPAPRGGWPEYVARLASLQCIRRGDGRVLVVEHLSCCGVDSAAVVFASSLHSTAMDVRACAEQFCQEHVATTRALSKAEGRDPQWGKPWRGLEIIIASLASKVEAEVYTEYGERWDVRQTVNALIQSRSSLLQFPLPSPPRFQTGLYADICTRPIGFSNWHRGPVPVTLPVSACLSSMRRH